VKMAKIMALYYWLKNHYKVYKIQYLALTTIITCKVFIRKILLLQSIKIQISMATSGSHIEPVSNKAYRLF